MASAKKTVEGVGRIHGKTHTLLDITDSRRGGEDPQQHTLLDTTGRMWHVPSRRRSPPVVDEHTPLSKRDKTAR
eukprot:scaffold22639_cov105-Cylindrotheca_fusiformis.AAC.7